MTHKVSRSLILVGTFLFLSGCNSGGKSLDSTISEVHPVDKAQMSRSGANTHQSSIKTEEIFLTKNITGLSGTVYQLSLPSNWIEEVNPTKQNNDLEFMLSDKKEQEFVACIIENKEDFTNLTAYTGLVSERLNQLNSVPIQFQDVNVGGIPSKIAEFATEVNGVKLSYIYHVTETKSSYVQLYGWTFTRLFESSQDRLQNILNSFKET